MKDDCDFLAKNFVMSLQTIEIYELFLGVKLHHLFGSEDDSKV